MTIPMDQKSVSNVSSSPPTTISGAEKVMHPGFVMLDNNVFWMMTWSMTVMMHLFCDEIDDFDRDDDRKSQKGE